MGRISGVSDISSQSSFGRSRVTVEFDDSTDLNVAASDARDSDRAGARTSCRTTSTSRGS